MPHLIVTNAERLLFRSTLIVMQGLLLCYQFGQQLCTVMYWTLWLLYTRVVNQTLMPWRTPPKLNKQPRHVAVCLQKHIPGVDRERVATSLVQWCLDAGAIQVTLYEPTGSLGKDFGAKLEAHLGHFLCDKKSNTPKAGVLFHGARLSAIDGSTIKLNIRTGSVNEERIFRSETEKQHTIADDERTVLLLSKRDGYTDAARVARETISDVLHDRDTPVKFKNMKADMSAHRGMGDVDLVVRIQDVCCDSGSDDLPPFILATAEIMTIRPVFGLWTIYPLFLDALVTFAGSQQRRGK